MYLVLESYASDVWGGERVDQEVSAPVLHGHAHPPLHHQPAEGGVSDRMERQKIHNLYLSFAIFGEHLQRKWTSL